eukprot:scaffold41124_cov63-Phaeocystis_antarctica.AAC.1
MPLDVHLEHQHLALGLPEARELIVHAHCAHLRNPLYTAHEEALILVVWVEAGGVRAGVGLRRDGQISGAVGNGMVPQRRAPCTRSVEDDMLRRPCPYEAQRRDAGQRRVLGDLLAHRPDQAHVVLLHRLEAHEQAALRRAAPLPQVHEEVTHVATDDIVRRGAHVDERAAQVGGLRHRVHRLDELRDVVVAAPEVEVGRGEKEGAVRREGR